jgi:hypothetical protein
MVSYLASSSRALSIGVLDTLIIPSIGLFISEIRKIAAEADRAQTHSTRMTVALRGANSPKLV